ncbi:MAG: EamA family transporter, partial [Oscillospiraceae bacterium]|nr:EamA family transporter [Oscillospiraceae bacterium]
GAVLALVVTVLPYLVYTIGLRTVEAGKASVMATVEPVVATLVGVIVFSEQLSASGVIGIILVAASLAMLNIKTEKEKNI